MTDVAPAAAAVPKLSGAFAGGSVAERVAERRRESATAKAGAAAVPQVEDVQVTESPAAPTEGLTLNFLATQLLVLQDKVKAQEVAQTESRQIMEAQRDEIEQLARRVSVLACAFDRTERGTARLVWSARQSEQGDPARAQKAAVEQRETERQERKHEEHKQREQELRREVERSFEELRKAQTEVVKLKSRLEVAERNAAARQAEVYKAVERAKQAAEKRGERAENEAAKYECEKWWTKSEKIDEKRPETSEKPEKRTKAGETREERKEATEAQENSVAPSEKTAEGVEQRWPECFSKVGHQRWCSDDGEASWEMLDVAEDLCHKSVRTLEMGKARQAGGEKVGASRTANTSEREGDGFDGCTYCWKTNHKEAECFRKRNGKPRLRKPRSGTNDRKSRSERTREKKTGHAGEKEQFGKQGAWEHVEPTGGGVPLAEVQCFKCKQYGHYRNDCPGGVKESKHETKGEDKPEAKHAKDAFTETEALASTKVEPKPMTPAELGMPEHANDIERYIASSTAAMANAQRESATRR